MTPTQTQAQTQTKIQTVRDRWTGPAREQASTHHLEHRQHPDQPQDRRPRPDRQRRLPGRAMARLRGLLHAQALINGTTSGPYDAAFIEDDRGRLSGRRGQ